MLKNEEFKKLKNGREWPEIWSGDAIEIERKLFMSSTETEKIKVLCFNHILKSKSPNSYR